MMPVFFRTTPEATRRFLLTLGLLGLGATAAYAQNNVGVGTTSPDASAVLDVSSTSKGLLAPRLTQAQRNAISSPATGLLVYQTDNTPGFYVYNGTAWTAVGSGTGTPAAQTLSLNGQTLSLSGGGGSVTLPPAPGDNLGNHTATQNLNLQGNALTGSGANLPSGVKGLGVRADGGLNLGQYSRNNVLLGYQAGQSLTTGEDNTFSGANSGLNNTTGRSNVFVGNNSGVFNTTGINITALGAGSGPVSDRNGLENATAIGAGATLTRSNTVILGNNASVGIGTTEPFEKLEVVGNVKIQGTGNGLMFPDGTMQTTAATAGSDQRLSLNGQTLTISGTGGNSVTLPTAPGDNLGNHTATQTLILQGNAIIGTGANLGTTVGIGVRADGGLNIGQNTGSNVYLGYQSGQANISGQGNTFSGFSSGRRNTGGSNTFSGSNSGESNTTGFGNTFVGYYSGQHNTTGSSLTVLGAGSGPSIAATGLTNATAVGANVTLANSNTVILGNNANVGIGTNNPVVPLDVQTSAGYNVSNYAYLSATDPNKTAAYFNGSNIVNVSIRTSGRIVAPEFNTNSDRRLKSVIGLSDRAADLALLTKIRVTDYTMRDRVQFGDRRFKKVIAQEVEEVFPQAVNKQTGFLPDVYALASGLRAEADQLWLELPAGLPTAATAGQRLKLIGATGTEVLATLAQPAAAGARRVALRPAAGLPTDAKQLFVFGFEHQDVRAVDYEALAMLNVSATQELARQLAELQARNTELQAREASHSAQASADLNSLKADLQSLRTLVRQLQGEAATAQATR